MRNEVIISDSREVHNLLFLVPHIETMSTFTTKSGNAITFGVGSGTKWQWFKKGQKGGKLTQELVDQLVMAVDVGFNHIDTAEFYTTHEEVGAAIKQCGKDREDLFITTKYNPHFEDGQALSLGPCDLIDKALAELDTDYVDLFLIHTPMFSVTNSRGMTLEMAWQEMIEIKKSGKARHIGVLNFFVHHLQTIMESGINPEINQIEFHPQLQSGGGRLLPGTWNPIGSLWAIITIV